MVFIILSQPIIYKLRFIFFKVFAADAEHYEAEQE